ncbi:MAG: hypothetical protein HY960_03150 [Ignavibacteriae bacterium]|nr:hypothetical protein [Ignavibacteriota bacterium]
MIKEVRSEYNKQFTQERYNSFLQEVNNTYRFPVDFRLAETPIFLSQEFTTKLYNACEEILSQLQSENFSQHAQTAIPPGLEVPNETNHTTFLQLDFALALDNDGTMVPRLIELQGFPSLYCYQVFQDKMFRKHFSIPENMVTYFSGLDKISYLNMMRETIVGNLNPENVILLEIEPFKQKTRIDFVCTEAMLGVQSVCVTEIVKRGSKLFYQNNGKEIPIERIYNRVIFDELLRKKPEMSFSLTDELDVTWVGHPNWYFKISKHTLPFLKSEYVPQTFFLNDLTEYPSDLSNFVLKPLYSFAGSGVEVDVTKEMLGNIQQKENYILQRKITYAPAIETPDGFSKAEIRMMFVWNEKPMLVNNLVRLSKGKMIGVDFNKDKTWVGSSLAYHY